VKILAVDLGSKRVGLAVSDEWGMLARPIPYAEAKADRKLAAEIQEIAGREQVGRILVGMPRNMDGSYGPAAERVRLFVGELEKVASIPVQLVDERLSTVEASRRLQEGGIDSRQQRERIDSASAAVMLQSYLDAQAALAPPPDDEREADEG
jgi:putative holliday junction resolvase